MALFFIFTSSLLYPFENIQVTLIGIITIGMPSFFLAFESDTRVFSGNFLVNIFMKAFPAGILQAIFLIGFYWFGKMSLNASQEQMATACTYLMMAMGIAVIAVAAGKLNRWKIAMIILLGAAGAGASILFPGLLSFVPVSAEITVCLAVVTAAFLAVYILVSLLFIPYLAKRFRR